MSYPVVPNLRKAIEKSSSQTIVEKTSEIITAFVSTNETTTGELPALISSGSPGSFGHFRGSA